MKHSIIMKVGENLIYQQSPHDKPTPESSSSPVEYNRALPEWEHTAKNYVIKKDDQAAFDEFMDVEKITKGIQVPHEFVEVYLDGQKNYARLNKTQDLSKVSQQAVTPIAKEQAQSKTQAPTTNAELKVAFEITIDDETGEPKIKFNNNNRLDVMTQKLLKSFAIKGERGGVKLTTGSNGDYEISITK